LHLDYGAPKADVADYMRNESRFRMIERADPARFKRFLEQAQEAAGRRFAVYQQLAGVKVPMGSNGSDASGDAAEAAAQTAQVAAQTAVVAPPPAKPAAPAQKEG